MPTIALLTDFGHRDGFVGVMKGVIVSICGSDSPLPLIDISHEVAPQDIRSASWILENSFPYFPAQTIFLCVVDPHVGHPDRQKLLLYWPDRELFFLGPDNGLFTPILKEAGDALKCYAIQNDIYFLDSQYQDDALGKTFQGRDVYAPAAAHLVKAIMDGHVYTFIDSLAKPCPNPVQISRPRAVLAGNSASGVIDYIDGYGNLITNIPNHWIQELYSGIGSPISFDIQTAKQSWVAPLCTSYTEGQSSGDLPFVVPGSHGQIELALFAQSAQKRLHSTVGDSVAFCRISTISG